MPRSASSPTRSNAASFSPGGLIVDGTAGNTGIGLTIVGNALGMKTVIVIPETQSPGEKGYAALARSILIEVPAVPYQNDNNYVKVAGAHCRAARRASIPKARSSPTSSTMSPTATSMSARPARKSGSRPTARSTASSARSAPAARSPGSRMALRERKPDSPSLSPTCPARRCYSFYTTGELKAEAARSPKGSARAASPPTSKASSPTTASSSPTRKASPITFALLKDEGLALGLSSGVNVAGAIRLARELGPGNTIVTMLCDPATRYQSRLFNPEFLRSKGLEPARVARTAAAVVEPDFRP